MRWAVLVAGCLLAGCGQTGPSLPPIVIPSATATDTPTTVPTVAPTEEPTPKPIPPPVTLTGHGSKVTDKFCLSLATMKVTWSAEGRDYFGVIVHREGDKSTLINEVPPNPASGETTFEATGDCRYYLEVKASTLTWTITFAVI